VVKLLAYISDEGLFSEFWCECICDSSKKFYQSSLKNEGGLQQDMREEVVEVATIGEPSID
jgi:hypothetical protein